MRNEKAEGDADEGKGVGGVIFARRNSAECCAEPVGLALVNEGQL
jgi:hypothetical protein